MEPCGLVSQGGVPLQRPPVFVSLCSSASPRTDVFFLTQPYAQQDTFPQRLNHSTDPRGVITFMDIAGRGSPPACGMNRRDPNALFVGWTSRDKVSPFSSGWPGTCGTPGPRDYRQSSPPRLTVLNLRVQAEELEQGSCPRPAISTVRI